MCENVTSNQWKPSTESSNHPPVPVLSSIRPEDAVPARHSERFQAKSPYKESTRYVTIILCLSKQFWEGKRKRKKKKKRAAFICTNGENWNVLNCNIKNRQKLHGIKSTLSQKSLNRNVLTVTKYTLSIWTERGSSLFGLSYLCVTAFRSIIRGTY